jgi:hypothetical protein
MVSAVQLLLLKSMPRGDQEVFVTNRLQNVIDRFFVNY